ncbi:MAG TPA: acylneuraminate cytidylyltransferase family protein [archaeon]|nr:acylneuraminate cytidylyltransferase family protein [archaeon]
MAEFVLGVITARGGSRGIKNKAIADLGGLPLIAYTIKSAAASRMLDDFIVSTDSRKIARAAESFGAKVPFMRPKELALDETLTLPVLKHAVRQYEKIFKKKAGIVVLLQPTSPFRKAKHIDEAVKLIASSKADSVFSVAPLEVSPKWLFKIENCELKFAFGKDFSKIRRQDTGGYYRLHGLIRVYRRSTLMKAKKYAVGRKILPLVTSKQDSIEIDSPEDLQIAEALLRAKKPKH